MNPSDDAESDPNVNTLWARVFVDELVRCGLDRVVIAPGSRSAPLVFQFAARDEIDDISIVDERSAAFFALGLARAQRRPVGLLCTSGTAAANFHPAVCEAAHDDVPLLVLTGNRPADDQECGAQQVMDQHRLYGDDVRWFHQVAQPEVRPEKLRYLRATVCRAWHHSQAPRPGPVHLDLPVRKPLEPVAGGGDPVPDRLPADVDAALRGREGARCWLRIAACPPSPGSDELERLAARIARAERPLIVAGTDGRGDAYRKAVRDFAAAASVPVLAEGGSRLRHWQDRGPAIFGTGELIAASRFYEPNRRPDLVLRLGHHPLTWALQGLVDHASEMIQVSAADRPIDPDHRLVEQIVAEPSALFARLAHLDCGGARDDWMALHRRADARVASELAEAATEYAALSAPRFWHELGALLPAGCRLHYSSSMLVRHFETFMCAHAHDLDVHFNRGLNGIDGVVSTAAGLAFERASRAHAVGTVLVIGDVALRHDMQSLMLAAELDLDLTVVVVDNDGGEIFEYLPSASFEAVHAKHFATAGRTPLPHLLPRAIALAQPRDWSELRDAMAKAIDAGGLQVIRVATDRRNDLALRGRLMERISDRLDASL
jgi:2-succinyl-5-enolpyruvyl-6-hydroxy-3-cyclohexene-1-carboxylate synthase